MMLRILNVSNKREQMKISSLRPASRDIEISSARDQHTPSVFLFFREGRRSPELRRRPTLFLDVGMFGLLIFSNSPSPYVVETLIACMGSCDAATAASLSALGTTAGDHSAGHPTSRKNASIHTHVNVNVDAKRKKGYVILTVTRCCKCMCMSMMDREIKSAGTYGVKEINTVTKTDDEW